MLYNLCKEKETKTDFLVVQQLRLSAPSVGGPGSVPGQGN